MKKGILFLKKASVVICAVMLASASVFGATYTATTSGNWSASSTWVGNVAPSFNLSTDAVIIPSGITVTMDNNVTVTGALASVAVNGTLSSSSTYGITVDALGTLSGTGTITSNSVTLNTGSVYTFSGSLTAGTFTTSVGSLQLSSGTITTQTLQLAAGTLTLQSGGSLTVANNGNINMAGGALAVSGGTLGLTNNYSVSYTNTASSTTGVELSGTGLQDVTVNVSAGNTVTLSGNLRVTGSLNLSSGSLAVGANTLTISGNVNGSGSGTISSGSTSNIVINTTGGIGGTLNFSGSSSVNNLTVAVGNANSVQIGGSLNVMGTLMLTSGTLSFNNGNLTLSGAMSGNGLLSGNSASNLTIAAAGGLSGALNFAGGGQAVNNFTINVGSGNSATLGTNLTVGGTLSLTGGSDLNLNGQTLTLNGDLSGSGSIGATGSSGLILNNNGSLTSDLNITGTLGSLTVNVGSGNSVTLGSNLTVSSSLSLQSGTLSLNSNNLSLSGTVAASGSGNVSSTSSSNISISTGGSTMGSLNFNSGSAVNNLSINIGSGNQANIGGTLTVAGSLQLTSGTLNFSNSSLTIDGNITGSGNLNANSSSNLTITTAAGLTGGLNFVSGGQTVGNFNVNVGSGHSVTLGSNLTIASGLSIAGGNSFNISGDSIWLNGNFTGGGTITADSVTTLVVNTVGNVTSQLNVVGGIVGSLVVNVPTGDSLTLAHDLTVNSNLSLQNGTLALNGNDLTVNGNISGGGSGMISSTALSSISIQTRISPSGSLSFTTGSSVNNLTVNVGSSGTLSVNSDIAVNGNLDFTSGNLNIDTNGIDVNGTITGSGSSSYIITSGSGYLGLSLTAGSSTWTTYPVGTSAHFAPVALQLNSGSTSGSVDVGATAGVWSHGTSGTDLSATQSSVDVSWMIEPDNTSNTNLNIKTMWSASMQVNGFDRTQAYVSHYTSGHWDVTSFASATTEANSMFSLTRMGVSSFSPFAVFDRNAVTAINETAAISDVDLMVYPNPATDNLVINNVAGLDKLNMEIVDISGKVMGRYELTENSTNIPLTGYSAGNYIIKLYNEKMTTVRKFVKM